MSETTLCACCGKREPGRYVIGRESFDLLYCYECIDRVEREERTGWIRVEDRLPEDDRTVIVFCPNHRTERVLLGLYSEGKTWVDPDWCLKITPTHWQPMPGPPEGE